LPGRQDWALVPLIRDMALGKQDALGRLYDAMAPAVNGLAHRILADPHDAEEVVLDVFMKAWQNAATFAPERGSVQGWLFTMTRTVAIDRIRKQRSQPRAAELGDHESEFISGDASPEQQTASSEWRVRVQHALNRLPSEQREAVVMAFFGGFSHSELAGRLGQPLGTVKTRVRAGLLRLRKTLEQPEFA
jgi:RNA polymerase sigma-70 factor (ECF subfamily)